MTKPLRVFVPITKVDAANRLVYGRIAAEEVDRAGEVFDYASSKPYFENWSSEMSKASGGKNLGNVRVMHTAKAAGMLTDIAFLDDEKAIDACAKVVDDDEWKKVEEGVYTGFSMGGSYARKWTENGVKKYTARPAEVSLVDAPCIKSATFELVRADGATELRKFVPREPTSPEIAKEAEALAKAAGGGAKWTDLIAEARAALVEKALGAGEKLDLTGHEECVEGPPPALGKAMERTTTTEKTSTTERMDDGEKKAEEESKEQKTEEKEKSADQTQDDDKAGGEKKAETKEEKVDGLASEDEKPADAEKIDAARGLVKQVWVTTDGQTFDKKDDCVKAQIDVGVAANPLTKAIGAAKAALKGDSPGEDPLAKFWREQPEGLNDLGKLSKALIALDGLAQGVSGYELKKSIWDVKSFADALSQLASVQQCLASEAQWEKDDSKNPANLREAVMALAAIFMDVAKEEISEMLALMPGGIATVSPESDPEVGVTIAQASKAVEATTLAKVGARNSKADIGRLQKIHDYLVELGVACSKEEVEKMQKDAAEVATLRKVVDDALPAIEELRKGIADQAAEIKKLKDLPMPGGPARLNVVEKGGAPETGQANPENVEKILATYTPEQIQMMMIKIAQSKPMSMVTRGRE